MTEAEKLALLIEWSQAQAKLAEIKPLVENELRLRKRVMEEYFPTPVEGANTFPLESGWELKGTYKIDRRVDEAALPIINGELKAMGTSIDSLIRVKIELDVTAYRALSQINPGAVRIFEKALISKPGTPSLELKPPKAVS